MSNKVLNHQFVAVALDRSRSSMDEAIDHLFSNLHREEEARSENRARMDAAARYETDVLRPTCGLASTLQVLDDSRRMIGVFPSQLGRGNAKISRERWVDYHYGYFTVSLASLCDIGIILVATVVQFGIAPKYCSADLVISHDAIRGTNIAPSLRQLVKSVRTVKERRNLHVHRAEHADVAHLDPDTFIRDLKSMSFVQTLDPSFTESRVLQKYWRAAAQKIRPRLDAEVEGAETAIVGLFDVLLPVFIRRSDTLRRFRRNSS
jgi:hypothetical protein